MQVYVRELIYYNNNHKRIKKHRRRTHMFIFKFFKALWVHLTYIRVLSRTYNDEQLVHKLSHIIGAQFHVDRAQRLYAVVNPAIRDGRYNQEQALEWSDTGQNNAEYVKKWMMDHLNILEKFILANNLFDMLTFKIEQIDDYGNYLCVLQPITFSPLCHRAKQALVEFCVLVVIAILVVVFVL